MILDCGKTKYYVTNSAAIFFIVLFQCDMQRFVFYSLSFPGVVNHIKEAIADISKLTIPSDDFRLWMVESKHGLMNICRLFVMVYELIGDNSGVENLPSMRTRKYKR